MPNSYSARSSPPSDSSASSSGFGIVASQSSQVRLTWPRLTIGTIPGMIGTSMPGRARRRHEVEVDLVVEEELGDQERSRPRRPWSSGTRGPCRGRPPRGAPRGSTRPRSPAREVRRRSSSRAPRRCRGRPRAGRSPAGPTGGSPRSARTFSIPDEAISSTTARSPSAVSPTQFRCAIASTPCSSRIALRDLEGAPAVVRGAAGPVGDREERRVEPAQDLDGLEAAGRGPRRSCRERTRPRSSARRAGGSRRCAWPGMVGERQVGLLTQGRCATPSSHYVASRMLGGQSVTVVF